MNYTGLSRAISSYFIKKATRNPGGFLPEVGNIPVAVL